MANQNDTIDFANLQGDPLGGLPKAAECFLMLEIRDVPTFKALARSTIVGHPTSLQMVVDVTKGHLKGKGNLIGVNVSFTKRGLIKLLGPQRASELVDPAFNAGLAGRTEILNDPPSDRWYLGRNADPIDVVVAITSGEEGIADGVIADARKIVEHQADAILQQLGVSVREFKPTIGGKAARIVGRTRPKSQGQRGHEHFGFLDGVSQPGLRAASALDGFELTRRENPYHEDGGDVQGVPGQDLLWPGEFVFGYRRQDPTANGIGVPAAPYAHAPWMKDGSLQVFRRLEQDVGAFWAFAKTEGDKMQPPTASPAEAYAASLVGRWRSGAALVTNTGGDNPADAQDRLKVNDFEFGGDADGLKCPFAAHIRKSYPRDDIAIPPKPGMSDDDLRDASEQDTQTHRILRRGIPFGSELGAADDEGFRGLLFVCYQTRIDDQFEFIQSRWTNDPEFAPGGKRPGHDMVIGQARRNINGSPGEREFSIDSKDAAGNMHRATARTMTEFVTMTGGLYAFMPSIRALREDFLA